ncbi:hypothetical protein HDU96_001205 [Phlyctochytrium bullatum]|nr:hypothetical protein HDU96_001205 [Phlyctochytrium bullatum]
MRIDVSTLAFIFRSCKKLIGFSVSVPLGKGSSSDTDSIISIPIHGLSDSTTHLTAEDIKELGEAVSRLQYLSCEVSVSSPMCHPIANVFTSNLGPLLRELHFSGVDFETDVSLCSKLGPNLEILRLTECAILDDSTLLVVPKQCPNLRVLDLWGSTSVSDLSVVPILQACDKLQAVDITFTSVGSRTVELLASSTIAPMIHTIFMEGIIVSPKILHDLIRQRGPLLRELILCGCLENATNVNEVLSFISTYAPNLRQLDVVGCAGPNPAQQSPAENNNTAPAEAGPQPPPTVTAPAGGTTPESSSDVTASADSTNPAQAAPAQEGEQPQTSPVKISSEAIWAVVEACDKLETFAIDEYAVEPAVFKELKAKKIEVEGVVVSPFWGIHF